MSFRWGILGPGRIAEKFAEAVGSIDGADIGAVASRSSDRAAAFAHRFGAPRHYDSYEQLATDPEIDAVYIATPHRFHFEQALLCLDAGKPVVCEKSITVNASQCRTLIQKATDNNVFLMEALWTRFLPIYSVVREWLDDDRIGDPALLTSTFCFPLTADRPDRLWRHDLAGGALLDIGIYNIAVSQWLLRSNPTDVSVVGRLNDSNVDESVSAVCTYPAPKAGATPVLSQFTCSFACDAPNNFTICGPKGLIRIHRRFWAATSATLHSVGKPEMTIDSPHDHNGFEYQIEAAMGCIRSGKIECPTMTHADSLANLELMDRIREAIGLRYDFE